MTEGNKIFSKDDVKRDIKSYLEDNFSTLSPLIIDYNAIDEQENSTFEVSFVVTMNEGQRAGFTGKVGYDENGKFKVYELPRYF